MDAGNSGNGCQSLHQEPLQVLAIAQGHFQQVIVFAGHVMAFQHLRHFLNGLLKVLHLMRLMQLQADLNKAKQVVAGLFRIQQCGVASNVSLAIAKHVALSIKCMLPKLTRA